MNNGINKNTYLDVVFSVLILILFSIMTPLVLAQPVGNSNFDSIQESKERISGKDIMLSGIFPKKNLIP